MAVNLHSFAGMYAHALDAADNILTKGWGHAQATGASEAEMLGWRLADDMHPLSFQFATVCGFARQWTAKAVGAPEPVAFPTFASVADVKAGIAAAKAYVAALTPDQFEGRDDEALTVKLGNGLEPTLPAGRWVTIFATSNIYFHLSMAYAILRSRGVPLGKADLFAGGL